MRWSGVGFFRLPLQHRTQRSTLTRRCTRKKGGEEVYDSGSLAARRNLLRNGDDEDEISSQRIWAKTKFRQNGPAGKIMMIALRITADLDCIFSATARCRSKLYTGPDLLPRRPPDCLDVTDSLPAAGGAADSASVPQSSSFTQKHSIDKSDGPGAFFRSP